MSSCLPCGASSSCIRGAGCGWLLPGAEPPSLTVKATEAAETGSPEACQAVLQLLGEQPCQGGLHLPGKVLQLQVQGAPSIRLPSTSSAPGGQRGWSPPWSSGVHRVAPRGLAAGRRRTYYEGADDTPSVQSTSTGHPPSVPRYCAPPTSPPPGTPGAGEGVAASLEAGAEGWPAQQRRTEFVVIPRSIELQAAEDELSLALVALVSGTRPVVSPAMVHQFLSDRFGMGREDAEVCRHDPEDFVTRFWRCEDHDRVLYTPSAAPNLPCSGTRGGGPRWPLVAPLCTVCWWG